jgi:hypothetical protein
MARSACVSSVQGCAATDCLRFLDLPGVVKAAVCFKKGLAVRGFSDTTPGARALSVKWLGFYITSATWEPLANIPEQFIQQYRKRLQAELSKADR